MFSFYRWGRWRSKKLDSLPKCQGQGLNIEPSENLDIIFLPFRGKTFHPFVHSPLTTSNSPSPHAAAAKLLQRCPTLCDPVDGSPPGSSVPGILQARTLKWVASSFSNAWKWKVTVKLLSHVQLFETQRTVAYQAPPSMGFSRQEYWSGLPLPSPFTPLLPIY